MGSVESLREVKEIISRCEKPVIVVVSAMSGVTSQLLELTRLAKEKKADDIEPIIAALFQRHVTTAEQLLEPALAQSFTESMKYLISENLSNACRWIIGSPDVTPLMTGRMEAHIVATGEMASSGLLRLLLDNASIAFAPEFIKTRRDSNGDHLDAEVTERLIKEHLSFPQTPVTVTQGFISSDSRADFETTLGRGGSDFTAALIAAALDAESLEIWTDVDGVMTADPRVDPTATVIPQLTYAQAQQIADDGAKVIYPPTIQPVASKNIPLWIKNTFNSEAPGTLIS